MRKWAIIPPHFITSAYFLATKHAGSHFTLFHLGLPKSGVFLHADGGWGINFNPHQGVSRGGWNLARTRNGSKFILRGYCYCLADMEVSVWTSFQRASMGPTMMHPPHDSWTQPLFAPISLLHQIPHWCTRQRTPVHSSCHCARTL